MYLLVINIVTHVILQMHFGTVRYITVASHCIKTSLISDCTVITLISSEYEKQC
jgi:hypothetical protein